MVMTNTGKEEIMAWLAGESATAPTHIAFGTGTTAATSNDTALETELDRNADTAVRSNAEVVFSTSIASTEQNGEDITEVGMLNASSAGDLFQRSVFNAIGKTSSFDIQIDITLRMK